MTPSHKTPGMEEALTNLFGYDRRTSIEANRCAPPSVGGCGGIATEFRDELSRREFTISGLCQRCQDSVFEESEEWAHDRRPL